MIEYMKTMQKQRMVKTVVTALLLFFGMTLATAQDPVFNSYDALTSKPSGSYSFNATGATSTEHQIIFLNDAEDHNWTYYSGVDNSVDGGSYNTNYKNKIYSPNPRNIRVIYHGLNPSDLKPLGTDGNVLTGSSAKCVAISKDEGEDEMVYLLTLESQGDDNNQYSYTVIPNPFSKRPKVGTTYYGFAGWKILNGGDKIDGKNNGDILSLEETLTLTDLDAGYTPNCLSAEIELVATWTTATVYTGTTAPGTSDFPTNGTYETNFWVLTGAAGNNAFTNLSQNMTISNYYPDGANRTTNAHTRSISVSSSFEGTVKFEWINLNLRSSNSINANGRNLYIGRGVTNIGNSGKLYGCNSNTTVNQTLRVESGTYRNLYHYGRTVSEGYHTKQHIILGCDYDRAKGDNTKLTITGEMRGGSSISVNKSSGEEISQTIGKSGKFVSDYHANVHDAAANYCYYVGISGTHNNGYKSLEIQGGEWANIAGGIDENNDSDKPSFLLRIKGGTVNGSIYGAAQYAGAAGTRIFAITGGTIKGWVAGGANGTQSTGGQLAGASYLYVGGKASVNSGGATTVINRAVGGNVFGAGCGYSATSTSGEVTLGTNVVIADNAYVERGVYGGGSYGFTQTTSNLYITGNAEIACNNGGVNGTSYTASVPGGVYGGASMNKGGYANIYMTGGNVKGSIYGGSNTSGTLSGNTAIKILGGEVGSNTESITGHVFGGGYGNSTAITGNTYVEVYDNVKINGNLYGGSMNGAVNGNADIVFGKSIPSSETPEVTPVLEVNNIFGAGSGASSNVAGNTTILMHSGHVLNNIYGGGEEGTVNSQSNAYDASKQLYISIDSSSVVDGTIFGGGKMGASYATSRVDINGGHIGGDVFAGAEGNANNTILLSGLRTLNMTGGEVEGSLYGGSRNASDGDHIVLAGETMPSSSTSVAKYISFINMSGGRLHTNVYGAGFYGELFGSSDINVGIVAINSANSANINRKTDLALTQECYIYGRIYGGANWGDFSGESGFSSTTTKGYAHIYIDGTGYDQTADELGNATGPHFMDIGGSIYGAGTSCYAGMLGNNINVRNFGLPITQTSTAFNNETEYTEVIGATRKLRTIQQCDTLILDNAHISFEGEGDMTTTDVTIKYCIYGIKEVAFFGNNSSVILNKRTENIKALRSVKIENFYAATPTFTTINLVSDGGSGSSTFANGIENVIRIKDGHALKIRYGSHPDFEYGELAGFFRIGIDSLFNSFAMARPKITSGSTQNTSDGGFLCYHTADATHNSFTDHGASGTNILQYPYTNSGTVFRVWRFSATPNYNLTTVPVSIVATVNPANGAFSQATALIYLPPYTGEDNHTRIEITDAEYSPEANLVDAALLYPDSTPKYMYYNPVELDHVPTNNASLDSLTNELAYITANPNSTFGLIIDPDGTASKDSIYIISKNTLSDEHKIDFVGTSTPGRVPEVNFLLTYSNAITTNTSLSPVTFIICRYDTVDGQEVLVDSILVPVTITTLTRLGQDITINSYISVGKTGYGNDCEQFTVKAVMPTFAKPDDADGYYFAITGVSFTPVNFIDGSGLSTTQAVANSMPANDYTFAMKCMQALNQDNSNGWTNEAVLDFDTTDVSSISNSNPFVIGLSDGRNLSAFDFSLFYNSFTDGNGTQKMADGLVGTYTFTIAYNTADDLSGTGGTFTITVPIIKKSTATKFYLDGIFGDNRNSGLYPDLAKRTLQGIFEIGYTTQDTIIVVNPIIVKRNSNLTWTNEKFSGRLITLYRYSGNHKLSVVEDAGDENYDQTAYNNAKYALKQNDTAFVVIESGTMTMYGIVLDGLSEYDGITHGCLNPQGLAISPRTPMVVVRQSDIPTGGSFILDGSSELRNSNNKGVTSEGKSIQGGAVYVDPISSCSIKGDAKIYNNQVQASRLSNQNGAGVFLDGGTAILNVNGLATINSNVKHFVDGSNAINFANNVYMRDVNNCVYVNTIEGDAVEENTSIGITKMLNANGNSLLNTPAVIGSDPTRVEEVFSRHTNFFDDLDVNIQYYQNSTDENYNNTTIYFKRK